MAEPAASPAPVSSPRSTQSVPAAEPAAPPAPVSSPRPAPSAPARSQFDLRAIQAIVTVIEQRMAEQAARTERRIAGVEANLKTAASQKVESEAAILRGQVVRTQREFAEAVARIVAEQVAVQVAERTAAIEVAAERRIEAAVAPLRAELRSLRQRLAETENTMRDFANAISDTVRMANTRAAVAAAERPQQPSTAALSAQAVGDERLGKHLDLRMLRQRLRSAELQNGIARPAAPFAPSPRQAPLARPARVA
ncbi:MAG TPA: hypothetical protein VKX45_23820 [Bryobacteraceae bacterium]|nr:hypothetical protein [Bryobacteraceae bacterium]